MQRDDAKTVSISHISVNAYIPKNPTLFKEGNIHFEYFDNDSIKTYTVSFVNENTAELTSL